MFQFSLRCAVSPNDQALLYTAPERSNFQCDHGKQLCHFFIAVVLIFTGVHVVCMLECVYACIFTCMWRSKIDVAKAESLSQSLSLLMWLLLIASSLWGAPGPPPFQAWNYRWAMTPIWPLCWFLETQTLVLMQVWQALYLLNHFLCNFIAILNLMLIPGDGYIYTYIIHTHACIQIHTNYYILF